MSVVTSWNAIYWTSHHEHAVWKGACFDDATVQHFNHRITASINPHLLDKRHPVIRPRPDDSEEGEPDRCRECAGERTRSARQKGFGDSIGCYFGVAKPFAQRRCITRMGQPDRDR